MKNISKLRSKLTKRYWLNIHRISYNENLSIKQSRRVYKEYKNAGLLYKRKGEVREKPLTKKEEREIFETAKGNIVFLNFDIKNTNGYIKGYLVTSQPLSEEQLKEIVYRLLPRRYQPINFKLATENGKTDGSKLVMFRDTEETIIFEKIF